MGVDACTATECPLVGAACRDHSGQALARRGQIPRGLFPPGTGLSVVRRGFRHTEFERCQSAPGRAEGPVRPAYSSTPGINDRVKALASLARAQELMSARRFGC